MVGQPHGTLILDRSSQSGVMQKAGVGDGQWWLDVVLVMVGHVMMGMLAPGIALMEVISSL